MKKPCFLIILFYFFTSSYGQQVVASAGKEFKNANLSLNFTIGEPVVLTLQNATIKLTQGFQQNIYSIATGIKTNGLDVSIKIFPNPTSDKLQIELPKLNNEEFSLTLFDMNGSIINQSKIGKDMQLQNIDVSQLASGIYFLQITNTAKDQMNTYKIEKINQ